jgi:hypothetical protein
LAGTADAGVLSDNKFMITPFIGKMITFIDEVRLEDVGVINTIKKLVRSRYVSGQEKYRDQRDYYIPSRLLIASNTVDIGLRTEDAADRCFFFIMAYTAENKRMTDGEFNAWTLTLKPFYDDFVSRLNDVVFCRHLMRIFADTECARSELEDLTHSSRYDENVVRATMSKAREIARDIVADARVILGLDITAWFNYQQLREAIKRFDNKGRVEVEQVLREFKSANVLVQVRGDIYKFKYKYGKLLQVMGEAHNLPLANSWEVEPGDWGDNEVDQNGSGPPWRGNKQQSQRQDYRRRDPDEMADY